jgi:PAS domain S-box-containing protein
MSTSAKKSDNAAEALYSTAPLGSGRESQNHDGLTSHLKDFVDRAFATLKALCFSPDLFIIIVYPDRAPRMEWAAGHFLPHVSKQFSPEAEPLVSLLRKTEVTVFPESNRIKGADPTFLSLPSGSLALVPLELTGDILAVIGVWQEQGHGRITPERLQALRNFAEMTELAASTADLSHDVQTQQMRLDLLNQEMGEIRRFYSQFSEAISQCFWVVDAVQGHVLMVSENFERVWGASRQILAEGLTGFMSSVCPEDRDRVLSAYHLSFGRSLDIEMRVIDQKGELRWIWLRSFATCDLADDGTPARLVLIADDITEKKSLEEVMRDREAHLIDQAKRIALSDLASGVAHEINNPLTVIIGRASEIRRHVREGKGDPAHLERLAERIETMSVRISQIILSLKALARKDSAQRLHYSTFQQVFNDVVDLSAEKFKSAGVRLTIPQFPSNLGAQMNPTLISQLILNLINNAFDAVQKEKEKWVEIDYTEDAESIFIYVTDSGPGIPIKIRNRIFDPFFTTKDAGKGTGLGLSLALGIASHHHGSLRIDHLHPHTRFSLQLPKRQPPTPGSGTTSAA